MWPSETKRQKIPLGIVRIRTERKGVEPCLKDSTRMSQTQWKTWTHRLRKPHPRKEGREGEHEKKDSLWKISNYQGKGRPYNQLKSKKKVYAQRNNSQVDVRLLNSTHRCGIIFTNAEKETFLLNWIHVSIWPILLEEGQIKSFFRKVKTECMTSSHSGSTHGSRGVAASSSVTW